MPGFPTGTVGTPTNREKARRYKTERGPQRIKTNRGKSAFPALKTYFYSPPQGNLRFPCYCRIAGSLGSHEEKPSAPLYLRPREEHPWQDVRPGVREHAASPDVQLSRVQVQAVHAGQGGARGLRACGCMWRSAGHGC